MLEELNKYINKSISIVLKNGKQKLGKIVYLDTEDNTISFEDDSSLAISYIREVGNGVQTIETISDKVIAVLKQEVIEAPKQDLIETLK